ncbi:uncharacterized protein PgNI_01801 [Pyricularia grisea]|uniref:Uncharacterized protein n=1 Tax=Pyricularia grisea TaxID=148305 RepID=A0A6P8BNG0_PYRGI|nr:uncharacterized protein PgNI_01801 [Pyricularia grisea]TLD17960.1 hypothetical protein PgNI_01801 [Pyricularia grisea]
MPAICVNGWDPAGRLSHVSQEPGNLHLETGSRRPRMKVKRSELGWDLRGDCQDMIRCSLGRATP